MPKRPNGEGKKKVSCAHCGVLFTVQVHRLSGSKSGLVYHDRACAAAARRGKALPCERPALASVAGKPISKKALATMIGCAAPTVRRAILLERARRAVPSTEPLDFPTPKAAVSALAPPRARRLADVVIAGVGFSSRDLRLAGLSAVTVRKRLRLGWQLGDALCRPKKRVVR